MNLESIRAVHPAVVRLCSLDTLSSNCFKIETISFRGRVPVVFPPPPPPCASQYRNKQKGLLGWEPLKFLCHFVPTHVALCIFIIQALASQLPFLANRHAEVAVLSLFWLTNSNKGICCTAEWPCCLFLTL